MHTLKVVGLLAAGAGVTILLLWAAPIVHGQPPPVPPAPPAPPAWAGPAPAPEPFVVGWSGPRLGVSVRDAEPAQTGRQSAETGVVIERVQPDSPAEKAGLKAADVIVEFDGERVRSARQFARLVSETSPGRTVTTTIVRDGRRQNLDVVPDEGSRDVSFFFDGPRLRAQVDDAARALRRFDGFNFDFDSDRVGGPSGPRLGVTVTELPPQLAAYFGVEDGVLITSVGDNSPASRAGLKAGDVVRSVDGTAVRSTPDLVRALRDAEEEVTLAIVRDKKEMTVKATPEPRRPRAPARPV